MPSPGLMLIGEEEKKELLDVIESGYLYRYGNASDPKFKQKVLTLEKNFAKNGLEIGENLTLYY